MSATSPPPSPVRSTPPAISRRAAWVLGSIGTLMLVGLVWLVVWAIGMSRNAPAPPPAPRFDRFESAWSSAMAKAGVRATFPEGPVDVTSLRASGRHSFEATFTAEEISALMCVYRFETEVGGSKAVVTEAEVTFPADGIGSLKAALRVERSRYSVKGSAPLTYDGEAIASPGFTELRAEGFDLGGSRRKQAGELLVEYLNRYLAAAPRLSIDEARIVAGALVVKGWAPDRLENPR